MEVQARNATDQYHIAIVDQGVGMSREAMAVANARLRGEQSFLVTPTRDLGHYVVGRLAQRLGIAVWLHDSPLTGVTARIVLPRTLLVTPERPTAAPSGPVVPAQVRGGTQRMLTEAGPTAGPVTGPGAGPMYTGTAVVVVPPTPPTPEVDAATTHYGGGGMATTRNGLVKRQPRDRTLRQPLDRPTAPVPPNSPPADIGERSPSEVRSMLDTFRSGVQRGEQKRTDEPQ